METGEAQIPLIPERYSIREAVAAPIKKMAIGAMAACCVFFLLGIVSIQDGPTFVDLLFSGVWLVGIAACAYALLSANNQKIEVTGEEITATTWYGCKRTFFWSNVGYFQMRRIGVVCFDVDGKRLFRLELPAENGDTFQADIQRRGIDIRPYVGKR